LLFAGQIPASPCKSLPRPAHFSHQSTGYLLGGTLLGASTILYHTLHGKRLHHHTPASSPPRFFLPEAEAPWVPGSARDEGRRNWSLEEPRPQSLLLLATPVSIPSPVSSLIASYRLVGLLGLRSNLGQPANLGSLFKCHIFGLLHLSPVRLWVPLVWRLRPAVNPPLRHAAGKRRASLANIQAVASHCTSAGTEYIDPEPCPLIGAATTLHPPRRAFFGPARTSL
jgi:hypothetical protein